MLVNKEKIFSKVKIDVRGRVLHALIDGGRKQVKQASPLSHKVREILAYNLYPEIDFSLHQFTV